MADAHTVVYNFTKPEVGGAEDTWGTSLNANFDLIEALLTGADDITSLSVGTIVATGQIKGIAPVAVNDLTRKDYVDAAVALRLLSTTAAATYLALAGGTVTGQIKGIAPVAVNDLTRKDYVDAQVATRLTPAAAAAAYESIWTDFASVTTTSGSSKDVVIPATATEIELVFDDVSLSGADNILVQLGSGGVPEVTGYTSVSNTQQTGGAAGGGSSTTGFLLFLNSAGSTISGVMRLRKVNGRWFAEHLANRQGSEAVNGSGQLSLASINVLRVKTSGANTFDAGAFSGRYR